MSSPSRTLASWRVASSMAALTCAVAGVSIAIAIATAGPATAAVYDAWTPVSPMSTGRFFHAAALLQDGRVLVAGGQTANNTLLSSVEIYNPVTDSWTPAHPMSAARRAAAAITLASGKVLVVGGAPATPEVYNPQTDTWTPTANNLSAPRVSPTVVQLKDGRVLVAGGSILGASTAA